MMAVLKSPVMINSEDPRKTLGMSIQVESAEYSTPLLFIKKIYNKLEMICVAVYGLHYNTETFC